MKHLFLSLQATDPDARIEHVALDADGVLLEHGRSTLAELASRLGELRAHESIVHAIIPAHDVAHFTVRLPPMAPSKIRASLPYALEDQLLEECDALQFAYDDTAPGANMKGKEARELAVATITRARLRTWLELLHSASIAPDAIHSEQSILLAREPGPITICLTAERVLCASPPTAVLEVERASATLELARNVADNLATWLSLLERAALERAALDRAVPDRGSGSEAPTVVELVGDRDSLTAIRPVLETLAASGRIRVREERAIHGFHWLASTALLVSPINLLQGEFAPREPRRFAWQRRFWRGPFFQGPFFQGPFFQGWLLPAALAGVLLLLFVVDLLIPRMFSPASIDAPARGAESVIERPGIDRPVADVKVDALYGLLESLALDGRASNLKLDELRFFVDPAQGERVELRARLGEDGGLQSLIAALEARGWSIDSRATVEAGAMDLVLTRRAATTSGSMNYATAPEIEAWLAAEGASPASASAAALTLAGPTADTPARVAISGAFADLLPRLERLPERGFAAAAAELRLAQSPGLVDGTLTLYRAP